jgi:GTP cyclohydrolase FolE2
LADGLSFRQVKLPTSLATETDEVTDERARNLLDLDEAVLSTYRHFLVRRADPDAWAGEVANIMAWVRDAVRHA